MATSGTYNWSPSQGRLVQAAFARVGVRRSEIVTEHLSNALNESNLMQAAWANDGPLLWTVTQESVNLVQGQPTYDVDPSVIMVLDVWISIPDNMNDGGTIDRIITPLSRTEYASMPEKLQQGAPTSYWLNRQISPTITTWPAPDGYGPYTMNYFVFKQIQDAEFSNQTQPEIKYQWVDAYVAGLAKRLKLIYPKQNDTPYQTFVAEADQAYEKASRQDTEGVGVYIQPNTSSLWRK
jgi:hypothetical protein